MKYIIFLIVILTSVITIKAQNSDCKYNKNEIDKFTKKKIVQTRWKEITPFISFKDNALMAAASSIDGKKSLNLELHHKKTIKIKGTPTEDILSHQAYIPENSNIIILFDDGNTMTLVSKEIFKGHTTYVKSENKYLYDYSDYELETVVVANYELLEENFNNLRSKGTTGLRIYYINSEDKEEYYDCDFGKKKTKILGDMMECIK